MQGKAERTLRCPDHQERKAANPSATLLCRAVEQGTSHQCHQNEANRPEADDNDDPDPPSRRSPWPPRPPPEFGHQIRRNEPHDRFATL